MANKRKTTCSQDNNKKCDLCCQLFPSCQELKEHFWSFSHHKVLEEKRKDSTHNCTVCFTSCTTLAEYEKHLNSAKHIEAVNQERSAVNQRKDTPPPLPFQTSKSGKTDHQNTEESEEVDGGQHYYYKQPWFNQFGTSQVFHENVGSWNNWHPNHQVNYDWNLSRNHFDMSWQNQGPYNYRNPNRYPVHNGAMPEEYQHGQRQKPNMQWHYQRHGRNNRPFTSSSEDQNKRNKLNDFNNTPIDRPFGQSQPGASRFSGNLSSRRGQTSFQSRPSSSDSKRAVEVNNGKRKPFAGKQSPVCQGSVSKARGSGRAVEVNNGKRKSFAGTQSPVYPGSVSKARGSGRGASRKRRSHLDQTQRSNRFHTNLDDEPPQGEHMTFYTGVTTNDSNKKTSESAHIISRKSPKFKNKTMDINSLGKPSNDKFKVSPFPKSPPGCSKEKFSANPSTDDNLRKGRLIQLINDPRSFRNKYKLATLLRKHKKPQSKRSVCVANLQMSEMFESIPQPTGVLELENLPAEIQEEITSLTSVESSVPDNNFRDSRQGSNSEEIPVREEPSLSSLQPQKDRRQLSGSVKQDDNNKSPTIVKPDPDPSSTQSNSIGSAENSAMPKLVIGSVFSMANVSIKVEPKSPSESPKPQYSEITKSCNLGTSVTSPNSLFTRSIFPQQSLGLSKSFKADTFQLALPPTRNEQFCLPLPQGDQPWKSIMAPFGNSGPTLESVLSPVSAHVESTCRERNSHNLTTAVNSTDNTKKMEISTSRNSPFPTTLDMPKTSATNGWPPGIAHQNVTSPVTLNSDKSLDLTEKASKVTPPSPALPTTPSPRGKGKGSSSKETVTQQSPPLPASSDLPEEKFTSLENSTMGYVNKVLQLSMKEDLLRQNVSAVNVQISAVQKLILKQQIKLAVLEQKKDQLVKEEEALRSERMKILQDAVSGSKLQTELPQINENSTAHSEILFKSPPSAVKKKTTPKSSKYKSLTGAPSPSTPLLELWQNQPVTTQPNTTPPQDSNNPIGECIDNQLCLPPKSPPTNQNTDANELSVLVNNVDAIDIPMEQSSSPREVTSTSSEEKTKPITKGKRKSSLPKFILSPKKPRGKKTTKKQSSSPKNEGSDTVSQKVKKGSSKVLVNTTIGGETVKSPPKKRAPKTKKANPALVIQNKLGLIGSQLPDFCMQYMGTLTPGDDEESIISKLATGVIQSQLTELAQALSPTQGTSQEHISDTGPVQSDSSSSGLVLSQSSDDPKSAEFFLSCLRSTGSEEVTSSVQHTVAKNTGNKHGKDAKKCYVLLERNSDPKQSVEGMEIKEEEIKGEGSQNSLAPCEDDSDSLPDLSEIIVREKLEAVEEDTMPSLSTPRKRLRMRKERNFVLGNTSVNSSSDSQEPQQTLPKRTVKTKHCKINSGNVPKMEPDSTAEIKTPVKGKALKSVNQKNHKVSRRSQSPKESDYSDSNSSTLENVYRGKKEFKGPDLIVTSIQVFKDDIYICYEGFFARKYKSDSIEFVVEYNTASVPIQCMAITTKGGESNTARVFLGGTGQMIFSFQEKSGVLDNKQSFGDKILCLHSRWGHLFIGLANGGVLIFDLKKNKAVGAYRCSNLAITSITSFTEGVRKVLCVASKDSSIGVFDASSGMMLRTLGGHTASPVTMQTSNGSLYSGSSDGRTLVHNVTTGELDCILSRSGGHISCVLPVIFNKMRYLLAGSYNKLVFCFDLQTNKLKQVYYGANYSVVTSIFFYKNVILSGNREGLVEAVPFKPDEEWPCKAGGCSYVFGLQDHRDYHMKVEHQLVQCSWKSCQQWLTTYDDKLISDHMTRHLIKA